MEWGTGGLRVIQASASPSPPCKACSWSPMSSCPPESPASTPLPSSTLKEVHHCGAAAARDAPPLPALRSPPPVHWSNAALPPVAAVVEATPAGHAFCAGNSTASTRPAFPRSWESQVSRSHLIGHWTLPPCLVTVHPRDKACFWRDIKAKMELRGHGLAQRPLADRDVLSSPVSPAHIG